MKVVIADRTGSAQVVSLPDPGLSRGCVAIRVSHSALHLPKELQELAGAPTFLRAAEDGRPIGSGVSGIVEAVGEDVRRLRAGLRVAAYGQPYVYHAERLIVPQNLVVELPKKVSHEEGAFAGQGAVAVNLLRTAALQYGETALVFGADLLGIMLAQVLRAAGVNVILVDAAELKLNKARNLGLPHVHGTDAPDAVQRTVAQLSEGHGVDASFVLKPNEASWLRAAGELTRPGGLLVLAAPQERHAMPGGVWDRALRVLVCDEPGPGRGDPSFERHGHEYPRHLIRWTERDNMACFCEMLSERRVQLSPLIGDRTPLERAPLLYDKIMRAPESTMAAVLTV